MKELTFDQWVSEVTALIDCQLGLSLLDLLDVPLYNTWADGITPQEAFDVFMSEYWQ